MKRVLILLVLALLAPWSGGVTRARQSPEAFLPPATAIGAGWVEIPAPAKEDESDGPAARGQAVARYGGPDGARITLRIIPSTANVNLQNWFAAVTARSQVGHTRDHEIDMAPPPAGCKQAARAEYWDTYGFKTALTACSTADVLIRATISGADDGSITADVSDALVGLALQTGGAAPIVIATLPAGTPVNGESAATPVPGNGASPAATPVAEISLVPGPVLDPGIPVNGRVMGNPNATVHLVEWGDNVCPHCGAFAAQIQPKLIEQYVKPGLITFEFRDYAFLGPDSDRAAAAAWCAEQQNQFWGFHDLLMANQGAAGGFSPERLRAIAEKLNLDLGAYDACVASDAPAKAVAASVAAGDAAGVNATPTLFINDQPVHWSSWEDLQNALDEALGKSK